MPARLAGAVVAALLLVLPSTAHATSWCSPETGDSCYAAQVKGGVARLTFETFSFRGKVKTCVTTPEGAETCRRFTLRATERGIFSFTRRWSRSFPNGGRGRYRVTFAPPGSPQPLGPGVSFRR